MRIDIEIETFVTILADFEFRDKATKTYHKYPFGTSLERTLYAGACGIGLGPYNPYDGPKATNQEQSVTGSNGNKMGERTYSGKVEKTRNARKRKSVIPARGIVSK